METGSTQLTVVANVNGGWDIREPGSIRALRHADTQEQAIQRARALLLLLGGGGVVVV